MVWGNCVKTQLPCTFRYPLQRRPLTVQKTVVKSGASRLSDGYCSLVCFCAHFVHKIKSIVIILITTKYL